MLSHAPRPQLSGVEGKCFMGRTSRCDGRLEAAEMGSVACKWCEKGASVSDWEDAKHRYNDACRLNHGDQLICTNVGCWQNIPKRKKHALCWTCHRNRSRSPNRQVSLDSTGALVEDLRTLRTKLSKATEALAEVDKQVVSIISNLR